MSSTKLIFYAVIVCFLTATACENKSKTSDKEIENPQLLTDYLGERIIRDFKGIVLDDAENLIKNVIISIGNKSTVTDSLGTFEIKSANVNSLFAFINSTKKGYINTDLSITPSDSLNKITIVLQKETEQCLFWFCKHNHNLP